MRVIVAVAPGDGHLYPTLPLAGTLRARGHEVLYAMVDEPALRARVESEGHAFVPVPPGLAEQRAIVERALSNDPTLAGIFGPLAPPAVAALVELVRQTGARLVVHDMASFAAPLAATLAGVASLHLGVGPSFPDEAVEAGARMAPLWERWGLAAPPLAGMFGSLYLDPFPPGLDNPIRSLTGLRRGYAPVPLGSSAGAAPADLPAPPWVWATLGTVFNRDRTSWSRLAAQLGEVGMPVVATVGEGVDAEALGALAPNLSVRTFLPAGAVLRGAAAVLCHGGAGTLLGALSHGLPVVCWPQGADQFHNARALVGAGAGVAIGDAGEAAAAIRQVLGTAGAARRAAAGRLQAELAAMATPEETASVVEQLVLAADPPRRA
ncbi:MAG TPA: glycosyltransferase [Acidimicrobiales bacterium]|nr:glycosyltransferase [Acidimicrobiales bacterium]